MSTQTKSKRRTTVVPVTTMEDVPVLDENERAKLLAALRRAEGEIASGKGAAYEPKALRDRLLAIVASGHHTSSLIIDSASRTVASRIPERPISP